MPYICCCNVVNLWELYYLLIIQKLIDFFGWLKMICNYGGINNYINIIGGENSGKFYWCLESRREKNSGKSKREKNSGKMYMHKYNRNKQHNSGIV